MTEKEPETKVNESIPVRPSKAKTRGRVIIYSKWCKQCGICVAFCPRNVLEQDSDGNVVVARPDECTGCFWCEWHCPDFAINVKRITDTVSE